MQPRHNTDPVGALLVDTGLVPADVADRISTASPAAPTG